MRKEERGKRKEENDDLAKTPRTPRKKRFSRRFYEPRHGGDEADSNEQLTMNNEKI